MATIYTVPETSYATHGQRAGGYIIDTLVMAAIIVGILYLNLEFGDGSYVKWSSQLDFIENWFYGALIEFLYYLIVETTFGTTPGKLATRTRIVDEFGDPPHKKAYVLRSLARMIPFERFSFLTPFCRGWHDKLSDTYVIDIETYSEEKDRFYKYQTANDNP